MPDKRFALITGVSGGIGMALAVAFAAEGYRVIGTDLDAPAADVKLDTFIAADLAAVATGGKAVAGLLDAVRARLSGAGLSVLVNNAALQVVRPLTELTADDFSRTLAVNVTAPFVLVCELYADLERAGGSVVNISSIHSTLTKPGFVAYATSKAALSGLTRALAIDIGNRVRVNAIAPAAIATPMLKSGFEGRSVELSALASMHPSNRIGEPTEVAELAIFLASPRAKFINGAVYDIDGGIGGRLHDPV